MFIYKPKEGKVTRIVLGLLLVGVVLMVDRFIILGLQNRGSTVLGEMKVGELVGWTISLLLLGGALFILNHKKVVSYEIQVETELKKVSWTTKKELISSTSVVVIAIIIIAIIYGIVDKLFERGIISGKYSIFEIVKGKGF